LEDDVALKIITNCKVSSMKKKNRLSQDIYIRHRTITTIMAGMKIHHRSRISMNPWLLFIQWLVVLTLFITPIGNANASSSTGTTKNYNIYNYDQTGQQFTPDGRLLQVEYASNAAELSSPLVVVECLPAISHETDHQASTPYPCLILMTVPRRMHAPQRRIVILDHESQPRHPDASSRSSRSSSAVVVVAMTGILADSLALLQATLEKDAEHVRRFQTPLGPVSLARTMADECQSRVFGGGIRPYGSTMLVVGYEEETVVADPADDDDKTHVQHRSVIFQTDPSGALLLHHQLLPAEHDDRGDTGTRRRPWQKGSTHGPSVAATAAPRAVRSHVRCVVGGTETARERLKKRLQRGLGTLEEEPTSRVDHESSSAAVTLLDRIATVAKILIMEARQDGTGGGEGNQDVTKRQLASDFPLEIVIMCPHLGGSYRLEEEQIDRIYKIIGDSI
jgi:hypothetical protein